MATELLKINGVRFDKFVKYDIEYNKLWGEDAGRDMAGNNGGTLIGIFPKIFIEIGALDENKMSKVLSIVNKPWVTVDWYDPEFKKVITGVKYQPNVPTASLRKLKTLKYNSMTFNLIPVGKRT